ncbi:MAG: hypothetical protein JWL84_4565, partial [Rhodospirillales bacterium]|nr:hypothetical protein [Rhodospirillales bacterium]
MHLLGLSFLSLVASLVGSATRLLAAPAPVGSVVPDPGFGLFRNLFPLVFVGGLIWLISRRVGKSTVMVFRHPTNGYEERVTNPFLWTMLFGPIYLASKGAWPYAILSLLCPPLWVFVFPFMAG